MCFEHPYLLAAVDIHSLRALGGSVFPSLERHTPLCGRSFCFDVSMLLPQSPAFVGQRETLLLPHEFSIVLLSSIKEKGGTPDSPHSGVVERLMSPQQTSLSRRKVRKRSVTPPVPQGSLALKKLELKCSWLPVYVIDTSALSELQYGCRSFVQPVEIISTAYQD